MKRRDPRIVLTLVLMGVVALYVGLLALHLSPFAAGTVARDFSTLWGAGGLARAGQLASAYDWPSLSAFLQTQGLATPLHAPWYYPPTLAFIVGPLSVLPHNWAWLVWTATSLGLMLWAVWRLWPDRMAVFATLASPVVFVCIIGGQTGLAIGALLALAGRDLLRGQTVMAALWIALMTVKPHLGVLIPFVLIASKQWRVLAVTTLMVMGLVGASILAFGVSPWLGWARNLVAMGPYVDTGTVIYTNMPTLYAVLRGAGLSSIPALLAHAALALPVAVLTVCLWAREGITLRSLAVLSTATVLVTPYLFNYDLPVLALACVLLASQAHRVRDYVVPAGIAALPLLSMLPGLAPRVATVAVLVGFWIYIVRFRNSTLAAP